MKTTNDITRKASQASATAILVALALVFGMLMLVVGGCASSNQHWAWDSGVTYHAVFVAPQEWARYQAIDKSLGGHGNGLCYFSPPNLLIVQQGHEYCLEHELGHLREAMEGLPPHSRYAH